MTVTSNSNRSASPLSTRPSNHNIRSTELNNPIRTSFTGNPFAKSSVSPNPHNLNCPKPSSDFGRRYSMDNVAGSTYDANDKENEKEQILKTVKMRSPSVPKNSKHFMAPTISTASKITAPSPRKKVPADKLESPRASINCMENFDSKTHIDPTVDAKVPPSISNVSGSDVVTDIESNLVGGDLSSRFKNSPSPILYSPCPTIAPLDADPLVAPYDPKTNFLSPRPQFLRYRPSPRIESNVHDDILAFDSLSDTETTEESGSASEELAVETEDDSSCLSDKVASFESLLDTETTGETETASERLVTDTKGDSWVENNVDDSDSIRTQLDVKGAESNGVPKKPFFTKMTSISLLLILVVAACLSVSLVDDQLKDQAFLKILGGPNEISKYVKENYDGVAEKISFWSWNCISYFTKPIQVSTNEQLSAVRFCNLTTLQDGELFPITLGSKMGDGFLSDEKGSVEIKDHGNKDVSVSRYVPEDEVHVEVMEETDADSEVEALGATENADIEAEDFDDETKMVDSEAIDFHELENVVSEVSTLSSSQHEEIDAVSEVEARGVPEKTDNEVNNVDEPENFHELENVVSEVSTLSSIQHEEFDAVSEVEALGVPEKTDHEANNVDEPENMGSEVPILSSTQHEVIDQSENPLMIKPENNHETEEIDDSSEPTVSSNLDEIPVTFATWDSTTDNNHSEEKVSSLKNIFSVCLLATSLILAATFVVVKHMKSPKPKETVTKKAWSATEEYTHSPSLNGDNQTEVIMESEPCQSEMSSSFEAQSCENGRMLKKGSGKRESLASSSNVSMGSASYGSFTTYEIIQKKHGDEEERMVTPVRRSSRIRSHVPSPL